ncbi:MAG TPA: zinc-binding dehydrogenase [Planctomycetota bacterium]|nr:zinc-binding dehydrogenase [Planctomycetota bacterium]
MSRAVRAIVFTAPGEIALRDFALPEPEAGHLVVETIYSTVSPGTELRGLAGTKESQDRFPIVPGYAVVGRVIEVGAAVRGWSVGELVAASGGEERFPGHARLWGGHASLHRYLPEDVVKLPADADPWAYVFTELIAITHRGIAATGAAAGESAAVVGQGMVGALAARWLMHAGVRVSVTDLVPARLERARGWGAYATIEGRLDDARERLRATLGVGADIVVEASASIAGAQLARTLVRPGLMRLAHATFRPDLARSAAIWPRLLYLATYTATMAITPSGAEDTEGALVLTTCDRSREDRDAAVAAIARGWFATADFLAAPTPASDAPAAYRRLRDRPAEVTALSFTW